MSTGAALAAESVHKSFGDVVALRGVSLSVAPGERVALVRGSGSGKSTLLRAFNGLTHPDAGRVTVDGVDVRTADPVALRRRIGYVPQDGGLIPHWTVRRNTELVPRLRAMDDSAGTSSRDPCSGGASIPATQSSHSPQPRTYCGGIHLVLQLLQRAISVRCSPRFRLPPGG